MENRINIQQLAPKAYEQLINLGSLIQNSQLSSIHYELIKIRASQINHCAFCINMHTTDALKNGETNQRIFLLNAWRETELFDNEEKVILAMTEEISLIHENGLSDSTYQEAKKLFDDSYIAQIIMAIVSINAWNRIAVSTNKKIESFVAMEK
ncbi:carboxymuconolactone decarboxylase family protein [Sunxiuqinia elliptica]|uniref:AhpD family alkylhydroperoxidase n=1 Tax=Sunxiuqinia elliptica TaxID=655355 RepID=A0A4R6GUG2_9BACT|nr:carboxymuconolactone decarboxylase family protein [Sunxiuqinia elliptica]TDN98324.1 AhpD family alkylhydroperoxidase [Sunxiuqinia elliptica]TDO60429.1 AhpD family alkylhydroperoxidase [Sunxiuqinia elliptica]